VHRDRAKLHELQSAIGDETSRLSAAAAVPIVASMVIAAPRHLAPSRLTSMVAALVAAMISASAVHAADTATLPLKATRFVSIGLAGSDAVSIATDRCVSRIQQRSTGALTACQLAARRAQDVSLDPLAAPLAARRDYAYALGNLAIAQSITGDAKAAQATTLLALQYSPDEPTLASNLAVLEARNLALSATVSTVK